MNSPIVSIITVLGRASPPIEQLARTVLRQTFAQWEWLIVDCGPAGDAASHTLEQLRAADPRIRVVADRVVDIGAARQAAARSARAGYLFLLDRGDDLAPTALEQWLWLLESHAEYAGAQGATTEIGGRRYMVPTGLRHAPLLENGPIRTSLVRKAANPRPFARASGAAGVQLGTELSRRPRAHSNAGLPGMKHLFEKPALRYALRATQDAFFGILDPEGARPKAISKGAVVSAIRVATKARHSIPNTLPFENRLPKREPCLLLILPWLTMGGADKFNLDMVKLLVEQYGYSLAIATLAEGDHSWLPLFAEYTPEIFTLHQFVRPADYPRFLRYLIGSRQIDTVVISNTFLGYGLLPYLRAFCPGVTFVDYLHAEDDHWKNGGFPRASLEQAARLDLTIVASAHLKQWMVARGADPARAEVCTVNIDTADWNPARYDRAALRGGLGIGADESVILYAARICLQKQPKLLVDVMIELERQNQRFVCLVAGDGPDRAWLEQFVQAKNIRSIRMLGLVDNQRMHELMAISDIFFLPSEMEGISMAIYEAMAMGAVPVGADVGGQRELVTPECGILVARDHAEAASYTEALLRLLRDPALRTRMRQASRQRVERGFGIGQMGARMAALLEHARDLARQAPRPAVAPGEGLEAAKRAFKRLRTEQVAERVKSALPLARRVLRPIYRWAAARMFPRLAALRGWAFQRLPLGGKR